jgi:hypothetical protein
VCSIEVFDDFDRGDHEIFIRCHVRSKSSTSLEDFVLFILFDHDDHEIFVRRISVCSMEGPLFKGISFRSIMVIVKIEGCQWVRSKGFFVYFQVDHPRSFCTMYVLLAFTIPIIITDTTTIDYYMLPPHDRWFTLITQNHTKEGTDVVILHCIPSTWIG